jgi:hypothetical protein
VARNFSPRYARTAAKPPERRDLNAAERQLLADIFGAPSVNAEGRRFYRFRGHVVRSVTTTTSTEGAPSTTVD